MHEWLQTIITVVFSVLASSGFWAYFTKKSEKRSASNKLLLGLARDRIIYLGMTYIERGSITKDEYDDFVRYLYKPYLEYGGNGLAEKVMLNVSQLPIQNYHKAYVRKVRKYRDAEESSEADDE